MTTLSTQKKDPATVAAVPGRGSTIKDGTVTMNSTNNTTAAPAAASRKRRREVEAHIESLIDLLDTMDGDPDFEDGGDLEPDLGAAERHPGIFWGIDGGHTQERWADGINDGREIENEHGGDVQDEPHDDSYTSGPDFEPDLGFVGIGTGWREGEAIDDREEDGDEQDCCHSEDEWRPGGPVLEFDGRGHQLAQDMIRGLPSAEKRADAYIEAGPPPVVYDFREARHD